VIANASSTLFLSQPQEGLKSGKANYGVASFPLFYCGRRGIEPGARGSPQQALSQQISDLEDELGLKLFTRSSRGVELTQSGRAFLNRGRRVLAAAKEAVEWAQEAAKGERGRLVIGSFGAFLTGVLSRFREQHPLVEITFLQMNNNPGDRRATSMC
jgi:hypothetical protein